MTAVGVMEDPRARWPGRGSFLGAARRYVLSVPTGLPTLLTGLLAAVPVIYRRFEGALWVVGITAAATVSLGLELVSSARARRRPSVAALAAFGAVCGGALPVIMQLLICPDACLTVWNQVWLFGVPVFGVGAGLGAVVLGLLWWRGRVPPPRGGDRFAWFPLLLAAALALSTVLPYAANALSYASRGGLDVKLAFRSLGPGPELVPEPRMGLIVRLLDSTGQSSEVEQQNDLAKGEGERWVYPELWTYQADGSGGHAAAVWRRPRDGVSFLVPADVGAYVAWTSAPPDTAGAGEPGAPRRVTVSSPLASPPTGRTTWWLDGDDATWTPRLVVSAGLPERRLVASRGTQVACFGLDDTEGLAQRLWTVDGVEAACLRAGAGRLMAVCWDCTAVCLDLASGRELWRRTLMGAPQPGYDPGRDIWLLPGDGKMQAIHGATGAIAWESDLGLAAERHVLDVAAMEDLVLVVDGGGASSAPLLSARIRALRAETGEPVWSQRLEDEPRVLGACGGLLLLQGGDGIVLGLDLSDGDRVLRRHFGAAATGLLTAGDRFTLCLGNGDLVLGQVTRRPAVGGH